MAKKPNVDRNQVDDLRTVHLLTFNSFSADPVMIEQETDGKINSRYARELLGVLIKHNFVESVEVEGETMYQTTNPGTYDSFTEDEALAAFDEWVATLPGQPTSKPAKAAKPKPEGTACYCGCGETAGSKSFYRPGHDARHAGQIGRQIAENYATPGFDRRELLAELPSEKLVAKAESVAETQIKKLEAKAAKANAKDIDGTITVGKQPGIEATKQKDGTVVRKDGKPVSKSAAATFEAA